MGRGSTMNRVDADQKTPELGHLLNGFLISE